MQTESTVRGAHSRRRPARRSPAPRPRGSAVGRYLILDTLAVGGMGVVYAAYDPELDRRIALKLLAPGPLDPASADAHRERLLREAQALAKLSHPNVIAIHDVGSVDDELFIAMELVDGASVREWLASAPRSRAEIVAVFRAAGRALAAAHAAGLVHRDFKPDNVLVGHDGRVRVVDFGLARGTVEADETITSTGERVTDSGRSSGSLGSGGGTSAREDERLGESSGDPASRGQRRLLVPITEDGVLLGTPAYMAPEQHGGAVVDARSDQFSFCVALYEALYGAKPFAGKSVRRLRRNVLLGALLPPPPGARVPRWLRRVLVRGLARDPDDRYPSMAGLLAALERPPVARLWRAAGAAALAALAVATGVSTLREPGRAAAPCRAPDAAASRVWNDDARASLRAGFLATGLPYAASSARRTEAALDRVVADMVALRADSCQSARAGSELPAQVLDLRTRCLARKLDGIAALVGLFGTAPDASVVDRAVSSVLAVGELSACRDDVALAAPLAPPDEPQRKELIDRGFAALARAEALEHAGQYARALAAAVTAADVAAAAEFAPLGAATALRKASVLDHLGQPGPARQLAWAAVEHAGEAHAPEALAEAWLQLARLAPDGHERSDDEQAILERAAASALALARWPDSLSADYHRARASAALRRGDADAAAADFERALVLVRKLRGDDDPETARGLADLATARERQGRFADAREALERATGVLESSLGSDHPDVAATLHALALALHRQRDYAAARGAMSRAIVILAAARGDHHPQVAKAFGDLALVYLDEGRPSEAKRTVDQALTVYAAALDPASAAIASALVVRGRAERALGRGQAAIATLERALAALEGSLAAAPCELARPRFELAQALWDGGGDQRRSRALAAQAEAAWRAGGGEHIARAEEVAGWLARHRR